MHKNSWLPEKRCIGKGRYVTELYTALSLSCFNEQVKINICASNNVIIIFHVVFNVFVVHCFLLGFSLGTSEIVLISLHVRSKTTSS